MTVRMPQKRGASCPSLQRSVRDVEQRAVAHPVSRAGAHALVARGSGFGLAVGPETFNLFSVAGDDFHVGLAGIADHRDLVLGVRVERIAGHGQQQGGDQDEKDVDQVDYRKQGIVGFGFVAQAACHCGLASASSICSSSSAYQRRRTWAMAEVMAAASRARMTAEKATVRLLAT